MPRTLSIRFLTAFMMLFTASSGLCAGKPAGAPDSRILIGVNTDSLVRAICTEYSTGFIEGIWQATANGVKIAIVPAKQWERATGHSLPEHDATIADEWALIILESPRPMVAPGTLMGWCSGAAKTGTYNAILYTAWKDRAMRSPRRFVLTMKDDGHLTLRRIHKGIVVNAWRFLPYMIRGAFKNVDDTPTDIDGFVRLWPRPRNSTSPVFL